MRTTTVTSASSRDADLVRRTANRTIREPYQSFYNKESGPIWEDVFIARLPTGSTGGIPAARIDETNIFQPRYYLGKAECEITKVKKVDPLVLGSDIYFEFVYARNSFIGGEWHNDSSETIKEWVYNPYLWRHHGIHVSGAFGRMCHIFREKNGFWMCERPPMTLKCIPQADVEINESVTVSVKQNGNSSGEETCWLNWMHGGEGITQGTECVMHFFEDENKWVFINAECEEEP